MNYKEQSLQLIATDQTNKFYLTPQAQQYLNNLKKPISIVSIAGMYRTGKSYLVNRLLKTKQSGFRTGATCQSVTKGLNIWGRPVSAVDETGKQFYYIVIDSEGMGSCQQQAKYDMKLLMLIFMISSTVVYNSMGAIDQQTLDQLRVIVNLKNTLGEQAPKQKTKLVWVLRDFALQLVDKNGQEITSNQYLQQCLQDVSGSNIQTRKKNQIRRAIREGLGKKSCFTLVRPTINEQDLADLNRCKLRTQFVNEIETIRQEVFSGSNQDLKRIEGHLLSGKLLVGLLQRSIDILNGNGMPELLSVWQSVRTVAYQQLFQEICQQMKVQLSRVLLPLSKQHLKIKLNEIQNKYYTKIQQTFLEIDSFKYFHRQFIKSLQKVNKQIKRSNSTLSKDKKLRDLRQFVKQNIPLTNLQPTNMSLIKTIIDRMQLKAYGETQAYEYVLTVLFDLMKVCQQKAIHMHNELTQYRKMVEISSMEQRNSNLSVMALKKDYHQALKTINNLKITQQQHQKQLALSKHQLQIQQNTLQNTQKQWQIRQSVLLRQIEQMSMKYRHKNDQVSLLIKQLRDQNTDLMCQLSQMKEVKLREGLSERKQVIFQQKMKQAWFKFDEQRVSLRNQVQKMRTMMQNWRTKYQQQRQSREQQQQNCIKAKQAFTVKQQQFIQQIKQVKNMHAEAKKTYYATFDTMKDNDRILKSVQNVAMSSSKMTISRKNQQQQKDVGAMKKFYQNQLQKSRIQNQEKARYLSQEVQRLKVQNKKQKDRLYQNQSKLKEYRQQKQSLQAELISSRQRFMETVGQIQMGKERERSLYEESIVRLLSNLDKKEKVEFNTYYK